MIRFINFTLMNLEEIKYTIMKKTYLILSLLLATTFAKAQTEEYPKNEVKLNIANTIAVASVEVGYERFVAFNQSVEIIGLINDRMNYHSESGSRKFNTNSIKIGYNYYFNQESAGAGIYANPFVKYRFGDFEKDGEETVDMDTFMVGLGAGYKWNFGDKFVLGPFVNIARNFSEDVKDRFSAIEFNAGFNVGYRF